jgi:hypothetical protein
VIVFEVLALEAPALTAVSQHGLHTLFEQIQSRSQSSFDKHAAPKQCPIHVQGRCDVVGVEAVGICVRLRVGPAVIVAIVKGVSSDGPCA